MSGGRGLVGAATLAAVAGLAAVPASGARAPRTAHVAVHAACSKPNSAHIPCYFSTPGGNIRCRWTPQSQAVVCELLAHKRGFLLHPTGAAVAFKPLLRHRGETLPTSQEIVFPQKLACRDSRLTIHCYQSEGTGSFRIGPTGLHAG